MKKTRIFMAFLMIVALLAFTGCSNDDGVDMDPGTNGTNDGIVDDNINDNNVNDNGVNGTDNVTGSGMNNNVAE